MAFVTGSRTSREARTDCVLLECVPSTETELSGGKTPLGKPKSWRISGVK
jgi:hypothetical protein